MRSEKQIKEEIARLQQCIEDRYNWISDVRVSNDDKYIYKCEIKEIENEIEILKWVIT